MVVFLPDGAGVMVGKLTLPPTSKRLRRLRGWLPIGSRV
jgi:hypothetical protein